MNAIKIIRAKRDGRALEDAEIEWFIRHYALGDQVADEQAAALAMAIFFNGMENRELVALTKAMVDTGSTIDLGSVERPTVDKHSTGGVGDKISLILVPLVVACGAAVPQLSGRGLGHTGGTLDKMESIAGWRAQLSEREFIAQLRTVGGVIAGASPDLAPADRKLYALRDVTATVESIPLIASSILSKKIAEGAGALVLDVKTGSGAFMADHDRARLLARTMVDLGQLNGVPTTALVTDMNQLLGRAAGNGLEVAEALDVLAGKGPADVIELTLALAREMLELVGIDTEPGRVLASGEGLEVFRRMVHSQGGDLDASLPRASCTRRITADESGFVTRIGARSIGHVAWSLGAGRTNMNDAVDHSAGVRSLVEIGDQVERGQELLELHGDGEDRLDRAVPAAAEAITIGPEPVARGPLILDRIVP
ncbi:MAG: thymidine phosphorylase [Acidimicrobiales bacterium]